MQSYSSPAVVATFCPPEEMNVFGPAMENHQKNAAGNQIIFDYVARLYRYPEGLLPRWPLVAAASGLLHEGRD